ncbi:hypothetical protein V8C26DRAFT_176775 [Trichoderma gracile]
MRTVDTEYHAKATLRITIDCLFSVLPWGVMIPSELRISSLPLPPRNRPGMGNVSLVLHNNSSSSSNTFRIRGSWAVLLRSKSHDRKKHAQLHQKPLETGACATPLHLQIWTLSIVQRSPDRPCRTGSQLYCTYLAVTEGAERRQMQGWRHKDKDNDRQSGKDPADVALLLLLRPAAVGLVGSLFSSDAQEPAFQIKQIDGQRRIEPPTSDGSD